MIKNKLKDLSYTSQGKVLSMTNDIVFKNIMKDKRNRRFLARIISICTKLNEDYVYNNIVLRDADTLENNVNEHHNTGDLLVDIEDTKINIEMCKDNEEINKRKI